MTPKFRVWDGEEMHLPIHDFLLASNGTLHRYNDDNKVVWGLEWGAIGCEVMFYTGLTDAEGMEIFEGDLVRLTYEDPTVTEPLTVQWCQIEGCWEMEEADESEVWYLARHNDRLRVIGNEFKHTHA